jgi:hypothetical protein
MELLTILAADYANVASGDKLNVMGIFSTIHATTFPARQQSMYIVIKLGADLGEYGQNRNLTVKFMDADGKLLHQVSLPFSIPTARGGVRPDINFVLGFNDIVFPQPGRYQFSVLVDKDVKGSLSLLVDQIEPAVPTPPSLPPAPAV